MRIHTTADLAHVYARAHTHTHTIGVHMFARTHVTTTRSICALTVSRCYDPSELPYASNADL